MDHLHVQLIFTLLLGFLNTFQAKVRQCIVHLILYLHIHSDGKQVFNVNICMMIFLQLNQNLRTQNTSNIPFNYGTIKIINILVPYSLVCPERLGH